MIKYILIAVLVFSWKTAFADMPTGLFLLVPQGARAEAMGRAVVSNCLDYTALYWNPAAAAFVPGFTLGADQVNLFPDANNDTMPNMYLAGIVPLKNFSFGFRYINQTAEVELFDQTGYSLGMNKAENSSNIGVTGAYRIFPELALGISLTHTSMRLLDVEANAFAVDAGLLFKKERLAAAVTLANLGQQVRFTEQGPLESLPMLNRIGLSYYLLSKKNLLCSIAVEKVWRMEKAGGQSFGVEYFPGRNFALRGGVGRRNDSSILYYAGVGISFAHFNLDFAHTSLVNDDNIDAMSSAAHGQYGFSYTH